MKMTELKTIPINVRHRPSSEDTDEDKDWRGTIVTYTSAEGDEIKVVGGLDPGLYEIYTLVSEDWIEEEVKKCGKINPEIACYSIGVFVNGELGEEFSIYDIRRDWEPYIVNKMEEMAEAQASPGEVLISLDILISTLIDMDNISIDDPDRFNDTEGGYAVSPDYDHEIYAENPDEQDDYEG
jgi:hypothetical protein